MPLYVWKIKAENARGNNAVPIDFAWAVWYNGANGGGLVCLINQNLVGKFSMNMRNEVIKEIKLKIVPELRNIGFTGAYPHFRRIFENGKVDYLSFQFNKYGGSFIIELAVAYPYKGRKGNFYDGDEVTPEVIKKSTSGNTRERFRIEPDNGEWFEYDENNYTQTVEAALKKLMKNIGFFDNPNGYLKRDRFRKLIHNLKIR